MTAEQAIESALGSMDTEGLNELNELLRAEPNKILPVLRFARNASVGAKKEIQEVSESDFYDTYRKLWRISKDFLKECLRTLDPSLAGLTSETLGRCEKSSEGSIRSLFFLATHTMPDTPWPAFCHRKNIFRKTFAAVYVARGSRLGNVKPIEKVDKVSIDWVSSGVFVFWPAGEKQKTQVRHIGGATATLSAEDSFDSEKSWDIIDNWCELRAQLRVGKAMTKIIELFDQTAKDEILKSWANNKEFIQNIANEQNVAADDDKCDGASSLPSAPSAERDEGAAPPPPAPKRKAPPPPPKRRVVAKRAT